MATRLGRLRMLLPWLGRGLCGLALLVLFVLGLGLGLAVHLDLATTRRVACSVLNGVLARLFEGRIEAGAIEHLGLAEIAVGPVTIRAPDGSEVLRADGLRLRPGALRDVLPSPAGSEPLRWRLGELRVQGLQLWLRSGPSGTLSLLEALRLREREPEEPTAAEPEVVPRPVVLDLRRIELEQVQVHGALAGMPPVEGEIGRLVAALQVGPGENLALDVERTEVAERTLFGAALHGSVVYHLRASPLRMWGDFQGDVGGLGLVANAEVDGPNVRATIDLPRIAPENLDAWMPGHPLRNPLAGRVSARGALPELELEATFGFPRLAPGEARGVVEARGRLRLGEPALLDVLVRASSIDTRTFGSDDWSASVGGWARVLGRLGGGAPQFRVVFAGEGTLRPGGALPPTEGTVLFDPERVVGWLRIAEPGSPADAWLGYDATNGLRAGIEIDVPRADAVPRLRALLTERSALAPPRGRTRLRARARWLEQRLDADFAAGLGPFEWSPAGATVRDAALGGTVEGPLTSLRLEAVARGHGLTVGGHQVSRFQATLAGPIAGPSLELEAVDAERRKLRARATVGPSARALQQVQLRLDRDGTVIEGRAASIHASGGKLALTGLELKGLGKGPVEGELRFADREVTGRLRAEGVELEPLRQLFGLPYPLRGTADLDVELSPAPGGRKGHVRVALHDGGMLVVSGVQLQFDAELDGDRIRPEAKLEVVLPGAAPSDEASSGAPADSCGGTIASLLLTDAEGRLAGPLLDPDSYLGATGKASLRFPGARLSCVGQVLAQVFYSGKPAPLEELGGSLDLSIDLERLGGSAYPTIRALRLATRGLRIIPRAESGEKPAWATDRLDLDLGATLDGATGQASAKLALLTGAPSPTRAERPLATLVLASGLDLDALLGSRLGRLGALCDTKLSARVEVPRRAVGDLLALPEPLRSRLPPMTGELQLDGSLEGTLQQPIAAVRLRGWNVSYPRQRGSTPDGALLTVPADAAPGTPPAAAGSTAPGPARATPAASTPWVPPIDFDVLTKYGARSSSLEGGIVLRGRRVASASSALLRDRPAWLSRW